MQRYMFGALLLAGALVGAAPADAQMSEEQRARTCAEAAERYREIHGRPVEDEPVTVVLMYKYTFCPGELTVRRGTTVRWVNVDKRTSHSVWFKDAGKDESERLFPEEIVEMTFDFPPGEYPYLCGPHWEREGMTGKVVVQE